MSRLKYFLLIQWATPCLPLYWEQWYYYVRLAFMLNMLSPWNKKFPTRPDTNRPVQPQKLARVFKFLLYNLEILYYLSSEQQRRWSDCADAQADLRICCRIWHKTHFLMALLKYYYYYQQRIFLTGIIVGNVVFRLNFYDITTNLCSPLPSVLKCM